MSQIGSPRSMTPAELAVSDAILSGRPMSDQITATESAGCTPEPLTMTVTAHLGELIVAMAELIERAEQIKQRISPSPPDGPPEDALKTAGELGIFDRVATCMLQANTALDILAEIEKSL